MRHLFQLHLLVLLFASTALIGRAIGEDVHAVAIVAWRTALAALAAGIWITLVKRRTLLLQHRHILHLLAIGAIIGLHWIAFFLSIQLSNASICLVGLASISLFTAFTEPWIQRTPLRRSEIALGMLVLAGITIITSGLLHGFQHFLPGFLVALVSAFLAAIFPVLNRRLVTTGSSPESMLFWEMIGACLVSLLLLPAFHLPTASILPSATSFAWLLLLALVCTVFAHGYHIHLLRHLSAYTSNLAINFEPVYGHLAAAIIYHENKELTPLFYLGFATIILANLLHLRTQSHPT